MIIFLWISILIAQLVCSADQTKISLSSTTNSYSKVQIKLGTPSQTLNVLLDTITSTTWVFDASVNFTGDQSGFNSSGSSTYESLGTSFSYTDLYTNDTTNGTLATDILLIGDVNLTSTDFGIADDDIDTLATESLDGILALGRNSDVLTKLVSDDKIDSYEISLDISNSKIYFGEYIGDDALNVSLITNISELSDAWIFPISNFKVGSAVISTATWYGVIDAGSPYLMFAVGSNFDTIWENLEGSDNEYNCNTTTRKCTTSSDIATSISFKISNQTYYIYDSDYYISKKLQIISTTQIESYNIIYFGKPFLETVIITLNNDTNIMTISSLPASESHKWTTVYIVLGSVLGFSIIFFGAYFYWNKIPPPTRVPVDEHVSLLHGPPISQGQTVGSVNPVPVTQDEVRARRLQILQQQQQQEQQPQQ